MANCAPFNDDCDDAMPFSYVGTFPFFNASATTDGLDHADCLYGAHMGIDKDVWYVFTTPYAGWIAVSTCGLTEIDSKLAVYSLETCPPGDIALEACNDDFCGLQSRALFYADVNTEYLIRVGVYPGQPGGEGSIFIEYVYRGANDCSLASEFYGEGVFPFLNWAATMDGVSHAACQLGGETGIDKDVWYCWTANETGTATVSTCGQTGVDTKIAAYDGCGDCPPGDDRLLACDDDACDYQ
jgi:hypothetical protein